MKFKKIFSVVASIALSLSLLASNVTAMETNAELTLMSESVTQAIDLSQLTANASDVLYEADYASISFNNEGNSEILHGEFVVSDNSSETSEENTLAVSPRASAIPLSSVSITGIWLGNTGYDMQSYELDNTWHDVLDDGSAYSSINASIDATEYSHIRFRVLQWGQSTASYNKLDNQSPTGIFSMRSLNSSGQPVSAGDIVYAEYTDYIFSIPTDKTTSVAKFIGYYDQVSPMITKQATVNITWTTPTGAAPTTPNIAYNMHSDYAYVSGVDTTMEYRAKFDNGDGTYSYSNWTAFTGTALYFPIYDYEYTLQIRYQTSTNGNPSLNCEIPVLTRSAGPSSYVEYDSISEILAIYTSEKQIEVALGDGASYVAISPAYYLVDTFIDAIPEGGFNRIYIRYAATATEPASNSLVLTLYGRNPNTPDAVYYENGALYNLTSDMVFRFNGGAWYSTQYSAVNVTSFMSSTETTLLEIRYMPTDSASCSAIREITLPILA